MWQIALTLTIVAAVLVYLIRYYSRAYRSESSVCSSCAARPAGHADSCAGVESLHRECPRPPEEQTPEGGRSGRQ
jgi:hypothetical protein